LDSDPNNHSGKSGASAGAGDGKGRKYALYSKNKEYDFSIIIVSTHQMSQRPVNQRRISRRLDQKWAQ
jgi:hypothetical protein